MTDRDSAVEFVSRIASGAVASRGPITVPQSRAAQRDLDRLLQRSLLPIEAVEETTWRAPTPWHCAAWLHHLAAAAIEGVEVQPRPPGLAAPLKFAPGLLFRGQRDASWEVAPSLLRNAYRAATSTGEFDQSRFEEALSVGFKSLNRFRLAIKELTSRDGDIGDLPDRVHFASAQHFGLPTFLLDLTVDPLIATWFACQGASEGDLAAVYWVSYERIADLRFTLVLAPPWIHPLYRQRGVFLDFLDGEFTDPHWSRIVFPAQPEYCPWLEAAAGEPMSPSNPWFSAAVRWATTSRLPVYNPSERVGPSLAEELVAVAGPPPFTFEATDPNQWRRQIDLLMDLCEWLAIRRTTDGFTLRCPPIQQIAKDNPHFVSIFEIAMRLGKQYFGRPVEPRGFRGHALKLIECLGLD